MTGRHPPATTRDRPGAPADGAVGPAVNPFDDPGLVSRYEEWYAGPGRRADRLEKRLLAKVLARFPQSRTVLEVGCGTGHFTRWFAERGLDATGLDTSTAVLAEARRLGGPAYLQGDAGALPFGDRAFDLASLITTLEFVPDPLRALAEAVRVARHGLILGVLNRHSLLVARYRRSGKEVWRAARFFTPRELADLVRQAAGDRLTRAWWRTTLWPLPVLGSLPLPWGGFIGPAARLRERGPAEAPASVAEPGPGVVPPLGPGTSVGTEDEGSA